MRLAFDSSVVAALHTARQELSARFASFGSLDVQHIQPNHPTRDETSFTIGFTV